MREFRGQDPNGDWTLKIENNSAQAMTLADWSLTIAEESPDGYAAARRKSTGNFRAGAIRQRAAILTESRRFYEALQILLLLAAFALMVRGIIKVA